MEVENLQSYLNWFIYLQRCKERNTQIILRNPVTHNKKLPCYHTIVIGPMSRFLEFPQSYPQDSKSVVLNIHNFQKMPKI
jgi:hypothetical protein